MSLYIKGRLEIHDSSLRVAKHHKLQNTFVIDGDIRAGEFVGKVYTPRLHGSASCSRLSVNLFCMRMGIGIQQVRKGLRHSFVIALNRRSGSEPCIYVPQNLQRKPYSSNYASHQWKRRRVRSIRQADTINSGARVDHMRASLRQGNTRPVLQEKVSDGVTQQKARKGGLPRSKIPSFTGLHVFVASIVMVMSAILPRIEVQASACLAAAHWLPGCNNDTT